MAKIVRLKMNCYKHREAMAIALAESGYCVWVEEKTKYTYGHGIDKSEYYICFEPTLKGGK